MGVVDIPIIHYSVYWWNTLHQGATISKLAQPSISGAMLQPLLVMLVGVGFFVLAVLCIRVRAEILHRGAQQHWVSVLIRKIA
jgi:heme exporter protein C